MSSPKDSHALKIEKLNKNFGALKTIDHFDLKVKPGERRGILGANGAGKTTLFNLITGDITPDSGSISFFGEDITRMPVQGRIRKGLRRTYQKSSLFKQLTVLENLKIAVKGVSPRYFSMIGFRSEKETLDEATRLAETLDLQQLLSTPASELSHGVARQLEIGMALAGEPRLILFDEPAAGLSPVERESILKIFNQFPETTTYIVIEHDMDIVFQISDTITVMHKGRFFAEGTPEEISSHEDVRKIYLGS